MAVSRTILAVLGIVTLIVGLVVGVLIGYYSAPRGKDTATWDKLTSKGDDSIRDKILEEIKADNIREYLRELTEHPHLAGTPADLEQAQKLTDFWKDAGLDHVNIVPYNVLLSYPSKDDPNHIVLYDGNNQSLHTSQLVEKIVRPEQNQSDVVPPFNAFSAPGTPRGELVYVNYGRVEDFTRLEEEMNFTFTGKICIARYGKIFRGDKAKAAERFGAAGLILYSDPSDYAVSGADTVYPESWWLPGTGVQRGSIYIDGDALTPGYPSTESAYRLNQSETDLPRIPVHPIGYEDAQHFLQNMTGPEAPADWQGDLPITYRLGPGFVDENWQVQMFISTHNVDATVYNAFGIIRGSVEPDRYVLMGNHRDAWVFGAVDPSSGTAVMMELSRALGKMVKEGWRPRRTIVFCSWAAEEHGLIGSREWVEHFGKVLGDRAVAYLNIDIAVQGNFTFRARALPMLFDTLYDVAKVIPNPSQSEIDKGRPMLWHTWKANFPPPGTTESDKPHIPILGSGSDFAPFVTKVGLTCADFRYHYDPSLGISSYPLYHSVYETFHLFETYMDPGFKLSKAVAQYTAEVTRRLAESYVLPFNVKAYSAALDNYLTSIEDGYGDLMRSNGLTKELGYLVDAVRMFTTATDKFSEKIYSVDLENPMEVREVNDQLMALERNFIDPIGLPGRPLVRNLVFAPSAHNSYAGSSFPGIVDTMFEIEKATPSEYDERWKAVRQALAAVTFSIETAAASLHDSTNYMDYADYSTQ